MTIGIYDSIVKTGTQKTVEASGASIANNAIAQADDATYGVLTDGAGAPHGIFDFTGAYTTAPTINTTLDVYATEQDIAGTGDAQTVTATYKPKFISSFTVNAVGSSGAQNLRFYAYDLPLLAYYSVFNNATGQTLNSTWTLKITPMTIGPSA